MTLAILCPGQGGQHPAMFESTAGIARAEAVLTRARKVLPAPPDELTASGAVVFRNRIAQPLVCAAILSRWEALRERLPRPGVVLGYSVGELAAHTIAGTLTIDTCLHLSVRRAQLMDAASPDGSGLTACLGLNQQRVDSLGTQHGTAIAIANSESHFVVGGSTASLDAFEQEAATLGARTTRLKVSVPAHTRWLARAADTFAQVLTQTDLNAPALPVLAGIDGRVVRDAAGAIDTLSAQIAQTLQWRQCVAQAVERGATVLFELGPGNALARIARELYPDCPARSLDDFKTLDGALGWVEQMLTR